ncbi:MAG: cupin domain-containing protein [Chloroflexi bacterium]|nr:cupin domain-containing protein [Chloroflexota bacterium]
MPITRQNDAVRQPIKPGRERYLTHSEHLMMVVIDFNDGPASVPDVPHSHPHEQITYVAEGRVIAFLDGVPFELSAGDMFVVPPNIPHGIQLLTAHARLVDTFNPIRQEFLDKTQA